MLNYIHNEVLIAPQSYSVQQVLKILKFFWYIAWVSKKNEEIKIMKKTMKDELKSYSSVLQDVCSADLAPKSIVSVVQKVNAQENAAKT